MDIREARKVMREALKDEGLMLAYRSYVAMYMYDRLHELGYKPRLRREDRNAIAEGLLTSLFKEGE